MTQKVVIPTKKYYEKNKDRLTASANEKILCNTCQLYISRSNMNKHKKSQKHNLELLKLNEQIDKELLKEKIYKEHPCKKIECECGVLIGEHYMSEHKLSAKHILRMYVNS